MGTLKTFQKPINTLVGPFVAFEGPLVPDAKFDRCKKWERVTAGCSGCWKLWLIGERPSKQTLSKVLKFENIIGEEMEKYKKLREIGQGSFGRVALVQEKKGKGRKLVLKEVEIKRMAEGEQEKVTRKGNQSP